MREVADLRKPAVPRAAFERAYLAAQVVQQLGAGRSCRQRDSVTSAASRMSAASAREHRGQLRIDGRQHRLRLGRQRWRRTTAAPPPGAPARSAARRSAPGSMVSPARGLQRRGAVLAEQDVGGIEAATVAAERPQIVPGARRRVRWPRPRRGRHDDGQAVRSAHRMAVVPARQSSTPAAVFDPVRQRRRQRVQVRKVPVTAGAGAPVQVRARA